MGRRGWWVLVGAVAVAACSSGDDSALDAARADLEAARNEAADVGAALEQAQADLEAVQRERDDAQREREEVVASFNDIESERDGEIRDREAAQAELEELRAAQEAALAELEAVRAEHAATQAQLQELVLRFDPQIQEAIAGAQAAAEAEACARGDSAGYTGEPSPGVPTILVGITAGLPDGAALDEAAIEAKIVECRAAGEARAAAETLIQPKGDGLWTVGVEIAPGRWRSTGTADDCYWKRSPDGNPDDIIDNHFGNAGGTVTIREGEEFETDDCGTWEFVG